MNDESTNLIMMKRLNQFERVFAEAQVLGEIEGLKEECKTLIEKVALDADDLSILDSLLSEIKNVGALSGDQIVRHLLNMTIGRRLERLIHSAGDLRKTKNIFDYRVGTLKRMVEQAKKDGKEPYLLIAEPFVQDQVLQALIEHTLWIDEKRIKGHLKDTTSFNFHLWYFKHLLERSDISKPTVHIASILENSQFYGPRPKVLKITTIDNRISKARVLISKAKEAGACHDPFEISAMPRINTVNFIKKISGGCDQCRVAWEKTIGFQQARTPSVVDAALDLMKKLPGLSSRIIGAATVFIEDSGLDVDEIKHWVDHLEAHREKPKKSKVTAART